MLSPWPLYPVLLTPSAQEPSQPIPGGSIQTSNLIPRPQRLIASRQIALSKDPHHLRGKSAHNRVKNPMVVEQHHIPLLPVVRIHQLRRDAGALESVANLSHLLQILHHRPIPQVQLFNSRGMDLERETASNRVLPHHRQDLDLPFVNLGQRRPRQLQAIRVHPQPRRAGAGIRHPDVRVRRVLDLCGSRERLVLVRQDVVHSVAAHERGSPEAHTQLVAGAVVVAQGLGTAAGHRDRKQRGHARGMELVQGGIDVPAEEPGDMVLLLRGHGELVERFVVRVFERDVLEAFVFRDGPVADDLDLGLVRDGAQVRVQDRTLRRDCLAVAVGFCAWVEAFGEFVLGPWGGGALVLDHQYVVMV